MSVTAPVELAARPQWVAWRFEQRDDKPTKVPYNARTGARASSTDPHTWATFEEACAFCTAQQCEGVGYVLSPEDPYVGVDLDKCRDPQSARIEPWAKDIIRRLASYTEISPSKTGIRIFIRGTLPPHGRRKGRIEIYSQARFLTITGDRYLGAPATIQDRADELLAWHTEVFGPPPEQRQNGHIQRSPVQLADADLLVKAKAAANGGVFWALWNGDYSSYGSQSEADLALVNHLAFWTGPDPARLDQLFRASGLMREKWDRADYRERTIATALEGKTEFYSPDSPSPQLVVNGRVIDTTTGEVLSEPIARTESRFRFLTAAEVKDRPAPEYVIEGVLQQNTVAMLVGAQETYKSFVGLDMAMCTAAGIPWAGHATQQGVTAYISAEGGSGLKQRITAWEIAHGRPVEHCYFLPDQAPQFLDRKQGGDVDELLKALAQLPEVPVEIYVDTLARTMVGGDENSAQDMGLFIASAEQVRQATGSTVVLVHHNNRQGSARGSSALMGAVHTIFECSREKNSPNVVVKCGKQKDAEHFETMIFTAKQISIDEDGRSSLVMEHRTLQQLQPSKPTVSASSEAALAALTRLGEASFAAWRDAAGLSPSTFKYARKELVDAGLVDHIADMYSPSDVAQMFGPTRANDRANGPIGPGSEERANDGALKGGPHWPSDGPSVDPFFEGPRANGDFEDWA